MSAATGNPALLDALADNFAAGVFHRQSSPDSRDWLARLIGTREVWQSTDRTTRGGAGVDGVGSRRRVREFLTRPDELRTLRTGEAFVWSTLGPGPERVQVTQARLTGTDRSLVSTDALHAPCGPTALPRSEQGPPGASDEGPGSHGEAPDVVGDAV